MIKELCEEPQELVDLFLNYDCDPEASNVFERAVTLVERFSQINNNSSFTRYVLHALVRIKLTLPHRADFK